MFFTPVLVYEILHWLYAELSYTTFNLLKFHSVLCPRCLEGCLLAAVEISVTLLKSELTLSCLKFCHSSSYISTSWINKREIQSFPLKYPGKHSWLLLPPSPSATITWTDVDFILELPYFLPHPVTAVYIKFLSYLSNVHSSFKPQSLYRKKMSVD